MAIKLNNIGYTHAQRLVKGGRVVVDDRDDWSKHQPTTEQENEFIESHGFHEYNKWHLGIDTQHGEHTKDHYKFPYGDFKKVHRCGVIAAESRAGQYKYHDIETAAAHLHGMINKGP